MQLKTYQQEVLETLTRFFTLARLKDHETAYDEITAEPDLKARLGKFRHYDTWASIADVPRVCVKVPTGGGKTILAAHAIRVAAETWMDEEYPIVLWFTPSDTIRKQTAHALQNPRHPYRKALDEQFGGRVRVYDIDEKFQITPQDIREHLCIVVSTVQSFKQSDTGKYNVYKHNENLESHFTHIQVTPQMERDERGNVKFSFANLLMAHRPLMVMDEAHNAVTNLSEVMQARLYPSAIIELTATPRLRNNTLYNVFAYELKQEAMIKLPVMLVEHEDWSQCVVQSVAKQAELEQMAAHERDYIRPIVLFQAQARGAEDAVTCDVLKSYLTDELGIPENQIAVATGEQHELDDVDVFDRSCPIRYVITVQALKEGWDCSFAYVLCSVANLKSATAIEQLLGRVLRMPYAQARKEDALNRSYAFVKSKHFGEAAEELVARLKQGGFEDSTAEDAVVEQKPVEDLPLFRSVTTVTIEQADGESDLVLADADIPASIIVTEEESGATSYTFTKETTEADVEKLCSVHTSETAKAKIKQGFQVYRKAYTAVHPEPVQSPAAVGQEFSVPRLMVNVQGELLPAETDALFERCEWDFAEWVPCQLSEEEFNIVTEGNAFRVDVEGQTVKYTIAAQPDYLPGYESEPFTPEMLTKWLVRKVKQDDVSHSVLLRWVSDAVHYLTVSRSLPMEGLYLNRFRIMDRLLAHIKDGRNRAKAQCHRMLFNDMEDVQVFAGAELKFFESMYDGESFYKGSYQFSKHYTGPNKVPTFDGNEGEEFRCAQYLDAMPEVKFWIRNVAKHPHSFWLPLAHARFYPDFIAQLTDGRIFVVEYKGSHLAGNQDSAEKRLIGELWAKKSGNSFLMAEKTKNGLNTQQQLKEALR